MLIITLYCTRVHKFIEKYCVGVKIHYFRCSKGDFYAKKLAILNISNAPWKKRRGFGTSWSDLFRYLHPANLISDGYLNKENQDALGGTVLLTSTKYFFFKFLKTIEKIGDYVDLANDQALVKYHFLVLSVLR